MPHSECSLGEDTDVNNRPSNISKSCLLERKSKKNKDADLGAGWITGLILILNLRIKDHHSPAGM
jgi:hypothetical protein